MLYDINKTITHASKLAPKFIEIAQGLNYESKGVFFSEIFFLFSTISTTNPIRIWESGRAKGLSTQLLCSIFPDSKIISVEFDANSPDVSIARTRLEPYNNLELLFGDAMKTIPQNISNNDFLFIDGPKGYRGLRLALKVLASKKVPAVFLHDSLPGSIERNYLELYIRDAFYSDDKSYVKQFSYIDNNRGKAMNDIIEHYKGVGRYGPTMACIPYNDNENYFIKLAQLEFFRLKNRLFSK